MKERKGRGGSWGEERGKERMREEREREKEMKIEWDKKRKRERDEVILRYTVQDVSRNSSNN